MTPDRYQRVKKVFLAVCERPENEQDDHVGAMCETDPELEKEVRSLLEAHRKVQHSNPTVNFNPSEKQTQEDPKEEKQDEKPAQEAEEKEEPSTKHRTRTGSGGRF